MGFIEILQNANWTVWLAHILLTPVYLILGTAKHEYAHAWAARRQGLTVAEIRLLPGWVMEDDGERFYWGYVRWAGFDPAKPLVYMLPYIVDIPLLVVGVLMTWVIVPMSWWTLHHHEFFATVIIGLVLPIIDVSYNLMKWLLLGSGDFAKAYGKIERFGGVS